MHAMAGFVYDPPEGRAGATEPFHLDNTSPVSALQTTWMLLSMTSMTEATAFPRGASNVNAH